MKIQVFIVYKTPSYFIKKNTLCINNKKLIFFAATENKVFFLDA